VRQQGGRANRVGAPTGWARQQVVSANKVRWGRPEIDIRQFAVSG